MKDTAHSTQVEPASDFYAPRRGAITDLGALIGMGLGALGASLTMWRLLATGFRTGEMERAFGLFLAAFLGTAAIGGVIGLGVGRLAGGIWERRHRRRRPHAVEATPQDPAPARLALVTVGTLTVRELSAESQRVLAIVKPESGKEGVPWGAWDGPRLVGVVWMSGRGADLTARMAIASGDYDGPRLAEAVAAASLPESRERSPTQSDD